MALHILQPQRTLGQDVGASIGTGLAQGLSALAQDKFKSMQAGKFAKSLEGIGVAPQVAQFLSQQSPEVQKDFISRLDFGDMGQGIQGGMPGSVGGIQGAPSEMSSGVPSSLGRAGGVSLRPTKEQQKEIADRFKETKGYRESILQSRKRAKADLVDLNRMEELSQSGKLDTPGYVEFLKRSGFDIPALMNPESEEFQKIQQGFLKGAKQHFGSRITDNELNQFLKTIPSLSQSPEGRKRVLAGLKKLARGEEEYYKAFEEVLKENKNVPPYDIQEQVERKVEKRLDKVAEMFKKDIEKEVPKGQNRLITALQAGAGDVLGNAGSLAKKVAKAGAGAYTGAQLGAAAGPIGAGAGGALGGLAGLFI